MMRVPLTIEEFSAMAFGRSRRSSTISLTNACRAGVSKELMMPCTTCSQMICLTVMIPVNVRTASSADCSSDAACVHEQDPAPVVPIHEHAGKRRDDERRDLSGESGDAEQQLRSGQPVDQPARRHARDPRADEGNALTAEEEAEVAMLQGARQAPRGRGHGFDSSPRTNRTDDVLHGRALIEREASGRTVRA